jgi:hypothetical protein
MKEKEKTKHGGRRAGAGRKVRDNPRAFLQVKIEAGHLEKFRKICADQKTSQPAKIMQWIDAEK